MVTSLQPILPSEWSLCLDDLVWKTEIVIPQKEITHDKICRLLSGDRCCYKVQQMACIFLASISNIDQVPKQAESMNSTEDKSIFLILLFTGPVFLAFFSLCSLCQTSGEQYMAIAVLCDEHVPETIYTLDHHITVCAQQNM